MTPTPIRRLARLLAVLLPLSACAVAPDPDAGALEAHDLRCMALSEPLGVDVAQPLLSWKLRSDERAQRQTAWQLVVATTPEDAARGVGDLWDSGRVEGADSLGIAYAGRPLRSHQRCSWSVRVWDAQGRASAWSAPASWTTGPLDGSFWEGSQWIGWDALRDDRPDEVVLRAARWIGHAGDGREGAPLDAPQGERLFAGSFELPAGAAVAAATLTVLADNSASCALNGELLFRDQPGWQEPRPRDVAALLRPGANELRVQVRNDDPGPSGLIAQLEVELADGQRSVFGSSEAWRGGPARVGWESGELPADALVPVRVLGEHGMGPWGVARHAGLRLPPVPHLRRAFEVGAPVRRALLYGSALGLADFHLNGARVSEERFTSGWTDYHQRVPYRCWDVTGMVRPGANMLGAQLADGWYSGYVGWGRKRDHYGRQPRLRCVLRLEHTDGTVTEVASGEGWTARDGALREADFLMGERYDARAALAGWSAPGGDAGEGWQPVVTGAEMDPALVWHQGPPVVVVGEFTPVGRSEPDPGVHVFDLGRNFAGAVRLRVQAPRGTELKLRFAERLDEDGRLYVTNLRGARAEDTYVCAGEGVEVWEPRFTFHGFQYVELSGLPEAPADEAVTGIAFSSDTPLVGSFASSSPMLDQLASNVLWTQRANFIEVPTDCPQRDERLGWTGDAQAYVATATLWTDTQAFFRKWLQDLSDAQRADGQLPTVAPQIVSGDDGGPGWADAGTIVPWEVYQRYGDRALLRRQYPSMLRFVEFCRARSVDEVMPPAQFHCFGDWVAIDAPTPHEVIYVAYYARSVELTARAAEVLGEAADAARLWELHGRLRRAFQDAFVDEAGRVRGDTQCAYVLPLAYDLLDGEQVAQAAAHLVRRIEDRGWHLSTGFLGTKELMLVLSKIGREDVAWRLMMNDTFPSWGFSIRHGATSIWERWDGWTPERGFQDPGMNSFAHYSFGAVYQWMVENIGGIRPLAPGYARIGIAPRPGGGLEHAAVGYDSVRGRIATAWRIADGAFHLEVEIPANTTAEVLVPTADPDSLRESGRSPEQAGLRVLERGERGVRLAVPSGSWSFTAAARG